LNTNEILNQPLYTNYTHYVELWRLESHRSSGFIRHVWRTAAVTGLVQLPDAAPLSLTQATILLGLVKCEATSKQWVTAVGDCGCKLGVALPLRV
jgi:hypothetical protein